MVQIKEKEYIMPQNYNELISKYPLKIIKDEKDNEYYLTIFKEISDIYINRPDLSFLGDYLEALAVFIEKFEEMAYPIPNVSGVDTLKFLMDQHELKQKDLIDIFKTPSITSEILHGKRSFTVEHIKKLSKRFGVKAEAFL